MTTGVGELLRLVVDHRGAAAGLAPEQIDVAIGEVGTCAGCRGRPCRPACAAARGRRSACRAGRSRLRVVDAGRRRAATVRFAMATFDGQLRAAAGSACRSAPCRPPRRPARCRGRRGARPRCHAGHAAGGEHGDGAAGRDLGRDPAAARRAAEQVQHAGQRAEPDRRDQRAQPRRASPSGPSRNSRQAAQPRTWRSACSDGRRRLVVGGAAGASRISPQSASRASAAATSPLRARLTSWRDAAGGDLERARDLLVAEPVELAHQQRRPLLLGQVGEVLDQPPQLVPAAERAVDVLARARAVAVLELGRRSRLRRSSSMQRLRTTRCSHGLSSIGRLVVAQRAVRAQERLLDDALGVAAGAAQRPRGGGVQAPPMAVVDGRRRRPPARRGRATRGARPSAGAGGREALRKPTSQRSAVLTQPCFCTWP